MLEAAQGMQAKMAEAAQTLASTVVEGASGGGAVATVAACAHRRPIARQTWAGFSRQVGREKSVPLALR